MRLDKTLQRNNGDAAVTTNSVQKVPSCPKLTFKTWPQIPTEETGKSYLPYNPIVHGFIMIEL